MKIIVVRVFICIGNRVYYHSCLRQLQQDREMFTGLIENIGEITAREEHGDAGSLTVRPRRDFVDLKYGESIAVNGACLTLEKVRSDGLLVFYTLSETLHRSNLGLLPLGAQVNLERAMKLGDRFGGHLVSGHVDAIGTVIELGQSGQGDFGLAVSLPEIMAPYLAEKGSIAIDGVSLTVIAVRDDRFTVGLIPVTLNDTVLAQRQPGQPVNLEADLLAKYVERQLQTTVLASNHGGKPVTMDMLREAGWE